MTASASELWTLVLAGGTGTRLWPLHRATRPKYLFKPPGAAGTLLADTLVRARRLCPVERVWLAASPSQVAVIQEGFAEARGARVLEEPERKDTLVPVALVAALVRHAAGASATLVVVPTDHLVPDHEAFQAGVETAFAVMAAAGAGAVLLGTPPLGPSAEYGYLQVTNGVADRLMSLVEKPTESEVRGLLSDPQTLWNTGVCLLQTDFVIDTVTHRFPALGEVLGEVVAEGLQRPDAVREFYARGPATSFERGVLASLTADEKERVLVHRAPFIRHDFGSYEGLAHALGADESGNCAAGDADFVQTAGSVAIVPPGKKAVLLGVQNLVLVQEDEVIMVVDRKQLGLIVPYVRELRRQGSRFA